MTEAHERLFFALWPDERVRSELSKVYNTLSSLAGRHRQVESSNLHMTLHFLGNIPLSGIDCYLKQAREVQGSAFELALNRIGHFKKPKVLWIGCESVPPDLYQLQSDLGAQIETCGFSQESRPYQPHVTMARKVSRPVDRQPVFNIPWVVDRFVLVQSRSLEAGVEYRVKASYPLKH